MKTTVTLLFVVFLCLNTIQADEKLDKLKIGIKKRVRTKNSKAQSKNIKFHVSSWLRSRIAIRKPKRVTCCTFTTPERF